MTDKELLEMAAKAAGLKVRWHSNSHYGPSMEIMEDDAGGPPWNPLTDDGDALRLAVVLGFNITRDFDRVDVFHRDGVDCTTEYLYDSPKTDPCAATRRAIVRAAAGVVA